MRERAAAAWTAAVAMPQRRPVGGDQADHDRAVVSVFRRVVQMLDAAAATDRVLLAEPDDDDLEVMLASCAGTLSRLEDLVEPDHAGVADVTPEPEPSRDRGIGPRTWLQPDGTFR